MGMPAAAMVADGILPATAATTVASAPRRRAHPTCPCLQSLSKGCKLWGAVIEVTPRELVVSLPHGLRGHVAYAEASDWLAEQSKKAEKVAAAAAADEEAERGAAAGRKRKAAAAAGVTLPPLSDLFHIGQLVRCTVAGLRTGPAAGEEAAGKAGKQGSKGASARKRVDLSLRVSKMNAGLGEQGWASVMPTSHLAMRLPLRSALCALLRWLQPLWEPAHHALIVSLVPSPVPSLPTGAESLKEGLALPACVRSVEDHGYLLALGVKVSRFCWAVGGCGG